MLKNSFSGFVTHSDRTLILKCYMLFMHPRSITTIFWLIESFLPELETKKCFTEQEFFSTVRPFVLIMFRMFRAFVFKGQTLSVWENGAFKSTFYRLL